MKKSKLIIIISIFLFIILAVIGIVFYANKNKKKIDNNIVNQINDYSNYFEYLESDKSKEVNYISYALMYLYFEDNVGIVKADVLKDKLLDLFDYKINDEKQNDLFASVSLEGVTYNYQTNDFNISLKYTKNSVLNKKLYKYVNTSNTSNKNTYTFKYDKYVINNPYDVLNEYSNSPNIVEINDIQDYLNGKKNESVIKKYITNDIAKKIGEKDKNGFTVKLINKKDKYYLSLD